jgi:hypothetical protein
MITRRAAVWLAILCVVLPVFSQTKKNSAGPRAVAVLEWTPQGMRLIPISLLINDHYYDATLYRANPIPMALDQDTVYEVQKSGDPIGDFTVTLAGQLPNGAWVGQGSYLSEEDRRKKAEERTKGREVAPKAVDPQEERPVLRHSTPKSDTPPASNTPTPSQPSTPAASSSDSKPVATTPAPAATTPETETDSDTGRPVLKRGKPGEEQAQKLGKDMLPHKAPLKQPAGINKMQVAVSDAGPSEAHPYTWKWAKPEEEQKFRADTQKLAFSLVSDYARKNGGPTPGKVEITDFRAFDLAYNNEPEVIFTARVLPAAPPAVRKSGAKATAPLPAVPTGFEYYVTLVATEDIYNQLQKMFSSVTDNKHLDAFPRYELVDAVDADGNKNGDLLFRRVTDISSSFVLYRVIGTRLEELLSVPEPREIAAGE